MEFNIEKLVKNKISFDEYYVMHNIYHNNQPALLDYMACIGKYPTSLFTKLRDAGYLLVNDTANIKFSDLKLTERFKQDFIEPELLQVVSTSDTMFDEFKAKYPNKVPDGYGGYRRLHLDLARAKKLYTNIVGDDLEMHANMQKCAEMYVNEYKKGARQRFMQNIATWLHQGAYKSYLDDIERDNSMQSTNPQKGFNDDI